jgi:hypothetical protein
VEPAVNDPVENNGEINLAEGTLSPEVVEDGTTKER